MTSDAAYLLTADRVVTCDPDRSSESGNPLGIIDNGAVLVRGDLVERVGRREEILVSARGTPLAAHVPLLTPGLVDAHTHLPWMGSRHDEYALRMRGAGYEEIAAAGGGIVASRLAVAAASADDIADVARQRAARMAALGVTTIEAKSGYGLLEEQERKQLEALRSLRSRDDVPRVVPTYLALHALPPEANGDRTAYAKQVAREGGPIDAFVREGLAQFVDAYIDRSAFSVVQARPALERARAAGAGIRLHIGQFADVGGAQLAAELGAASADHLEILDDSGARALAEAGVVGVLLPVASFTLGQAPPPVAALRDAGVPLAVASDANPGTAPTESLPLAMALAVRSYGLTVEETILGVTRIAAGSLGLGSKVGMLRAGLLADIAGWSVSHEAALIQPWGSSLTRFVLREGRVLHGALEGLD